MLSEFAQDGGKSVHINDIKTERQGRQKIIEVPIFKENNFGSKMTIDEKYIGEEEYTLMSNRNTGKIAMICKSVKFSELQEVFRRHPSVISRVESITRDLSSLYEKVSSEIFSTVRQIADKFHVIRLLMETHQAIRVRYRQKELEKRRTALKEFKKTEQQRMEEYERTDKKFKARRFHYQEMRLDNGETPLELLARSRYLLYKFSSQWTARQTERASVLFKLYPEIEQSYHLCCQFRDFFSKKNIGNHYLEIDKKLHKWYEEVEESDIDEMLNFKATVESNEQYIVNYFIQGETNALAEGTNSKIQKFISSNQGTRDRDFFFFRLANYFS